MQTLFNVLFGIAFTGIVCAALLIGLGVAKLVRWLRGGIHDNVDEHAEKPNPL